MRHGPARMEERQALHVMALSGPGQQNLRWQVAVVADTPIFKPCGRSPSSGGSHDRQKRYGLGRVLPTTVIADRQTKGGDGHGAQDCRSVLQRHSPWHDLSGSGGRGLRRATSETRAVKPPATRQDTGLRPSAHARTAGCFLGSNA